MAQVEYPNIEPVFPNGELYVVTRNSDLSEGRGHNVNESYWDNLDEAVEAARGINVQGSDGSVYRIVQLLPEKKVMYYGRRYDWDSRRYITEFTPESGRG